MWTDIVDGTGDVVATGEVNVQVPGSYVLSYNFTDAAGNEVCNTNDCGGGYDFRDYFNGDASIPTKLGVNIQMRVRCGRILWMDW